MSADKKKEPYTAVLIAENIAKVADDVARHVLDPLSLDGGDRVVLSDQPARGAVEWSLELDPQTQAQLGQSLRDYAENAPVDVALVARANRRKRLLICDMDSTIIRQECLDELADFAGVKDQVSAITERAMAGELDFEAALTERVAMLSGLPLSALQACYDQRIEEMPGARALVATMAENGAHCLLVSGGFTFFTSRVADAVGFHGDRANRLIDDGALLTGEVARPILGREAKLTALCEAADSLGLGAGDALAIGDGANDLAMIEAAGLGIAYHAKPIVAGAADAAIRQGDLRSALYYQGYHDDEITELRRPQS